MSGLMNLQNVNPDMARRPYVYHINHTQTGQQTSKLKICRKTTWWKHTTQLTEYKQIISWFLQQLHVGFCQLKRPLDNVVIQLCYTLATDSDVQPGGEAQQCTSSTSLNNKLILVPCEYLKFRIESNSYFSIRFDSKQAIIQNFRTLAVTNFLLN